MTNEVEQAPSHPATEASSSELPTSALPPSDCAPQAAGLRTQDSSADPRLSLPRAIAYRCCEKIQRQARAVAEHVGAMTTHHYDDSTNTYAGKELTPERASAMFEQAHALLVNVAQGAAGVYSAAGLEVPPEIAWAARGAVPPDARCAVRGAPDPSPDSLASNANYALIEDRADSDPPLRPAHAVRDAPCATAETRDPNPDSSSGASRTAHPAPLSLAATPLAGLSPAANDPAARSLPGAAA